jgi:hypothetical protein
MRHQGSKRKRRAVVVVLCSFLRVERRVRETCGPRVRGGIRVVVRMVAGEGQPSMTLTAHIVLAAASSAAFSIVGAWTGVGSAELCQIASAIVVGALAAAAASALVRRRMYGAERAELAALLGATAQLLLAEHARIPAARVLRVLLGPRQSAARTSVGVAIAALAPLPETVPRGALVRLALRPAARMLPAMGVALELHGAYRDSRDNARFVREFALAAARLCPASASLPGLMATRSCPAPASLPETHTGLLLCA